MSSSDLELYELLKEETRLKSQKDLLAFAIYTRSHYEPNWHHILLCEYLERFLAGEIPRLIVSMPPRHGKSELVSRCLPAYALGQDPDTTIIATSYGSSLAARMNRDVQRIIDSQEYREVFPETRLNTKNIRTVAQGTWLRNSSLFEIVDRRGSYRSAGVGGGITGEGLDIGIIDDPVKNQEQAYSALYREKVWEWYTSTLYTRLSGRKARILLTMTRWHEDDLAGRLLKQAREDPEADQWEELVLPAVREGIAHPRDPREIGEALWPSRFPLEVLNKNKANGSYYWNALFQQRPAPPKGGIVQRDWLQTYDRLPEGVTDWLLSWDLTFKETRKGSYVCGQVWCRKGASFYLVDQIRERMDFTRTLASITTFHARYPQAKVILIEDKANGPAIISVLKEHVPGVVAVPARDSKEARLHSVTPLFEARNVYLPRASWVKELAEELVSFPNSMHNDQVDTLSQALNRYMTKRRGALNLDLSVGLKYSAIGAYDA